MKFVFETRVFRRPNKVLFADSIELNQHQISNITTSSVFEGSGETDRSSGFEGSAENEELEPNELSSNEILNAFSFELPEDEDTWQFTLPTRKSGEEITLWPETTNEPPTTTTTTTTTTSTTTTTTSTTTSTTTTKRTTRRPRPTPTRRPTTRRTTPKPTTRRTTRPTTRKTARPTTTTTTRRTTRPTTRRTTKATTRPTTRPTTRRTTRRTTKATTTRRPITQETVVFGEDFQFLANQESMEAGLDLDRGRKNKQKKEEEKAKEEKLKEEKEEYDYEYGQGLHATYHDYGYVSGFSSQSRDAPAGFSCWACSRNYWDADSTGDLYADCRNFGEPELCDEHLEDSGSSHYSTPVSCQITERRFFGVVTELVVGCKQTQACQNNFIQNRMQGR